MKKSFTLLIILSITISVFAQAPQKLSYQAVIRNASGALVTNQAVGIKISILQGSASGTVVYAETYTPAPQTNSNGLVTVEIGSGTPSVGTFSTINWSNGSYFLKTETDPAGGTSYTITGTSQLLSVPYALNSKISEGVVDNSITSVKIADGSVTGADIGTNSISSAKIADNTILAADLTDNSVITSKINNLAVTTDKIATSAVTMDKISDGSVTTGKLAAGSVTTEKINSGAVTGPKIAQAGATTGQVLKWNNTTWVPANDETGSGLSLPYSGTVDYGFSAFTVTNNAGSAIYGKSSGNTYDCGVIGETDSPTGIGVLGNATGGFGGVQGTFNPSAGYGYGVSGFTQSSEGIGVKASSASLSGPTYGVYAETQSTSGTAIFGQSQAVSGNTKGVYVKDNSSSGTGVYSECLSGTGNTKAVHGKVISTDGFSGYFAGGKFYVSGRTGIGTTAPGAGLHLVGTGFPESFLYLQSNSDQDAGIRFYEATTPRWSLFCDGGTDGLQIYNNGGVTAIFCKQVSPCYVGIGTSNPTCQLQVGSTGDGSQARANAWNLLSDIRLKKDLSDLSEPLEMISKLNGFYFYWNTGTDKSRQVGFSAQDVQKVLPEVVSSSSDGYLAIEYSKMAPLFVEAIKALKTENEQLRARLERLEALINK